MLFTDSYDCIYRAYGKTGNDLDHLDTRVRVSLGHYACYSEAYSKIISYADITYEIFLFKEDMENKGYNLCDKLETKKILRNLQKTVPFTYKFTSGKCTLSKYTSMLADCNVLVVNIKGNYAQHVWVTSMLRCFYEWPYNIAAKEACYLSKQNIDDIDFSKECWINIYLSVAAILGGTGLHGFVGPYGYPKLRTYQEWNVKLKSIPTRNKIYHALLERECKKIKTEKVYNQTQYDTERDKRVSKYVAAYKDKLSWKK
jgi:hypothetical protein